MPNGVPKEGQQIPVILAKLGVLRWIIGIFFFAIGLATLDRASPKWCVAGLLLYSLPLLSQFQKRSFFRHASSWMALLLILQAAYGYHFPNYYYHNPPNDVWKLTLQDGSTTKIEFDSKGYRSGTSIDYRNKKGFRIFFLGASTTVMTNFSNKEMWSHLVQERLTRVTGVAVEAINTAVSGTRLRHHLATLNQVKSLSPDMAVFLLGINDWTRDMKGQLSPPSETMEYWSFNERNEDRYALKYSPLVNLFLRKKETAVVDPAVAASQSTQESRDVVTRRLSKDRPVVKSYRPERVSERYEKELRHLAEVCRGMQIPCLLMNQPVAYSQNASPELKDKFWMNPPPIAGYSVDLDSTIYTSNLYNQFLEDFAQKNGIPFCNLAGSLPPTLEYFTDEVHFTKKGNDRIADLVSGCLEKVLPRRALATRSGTPPSIK